MPATPPRRPPGQVRDSILAVMRGSGDMTVTAIVEGVRAALGDDVKASSVRSYLNLNEGPSKQFKRVKHGVYRLK